MATLSSGPVVVGAEHLQVSFDAAVPAAVEIDPGTVVAFETSDAIFRRLATGEPLGHEELQQANAETGPVGVRGAEPGDALRIEVLDVEIAAAWIVRMEGFGPLGAGVDGIRVTPARVESGRVFVADDVHVPFDPWSAASVSLPRAAQRRRCDRSIRPEETSISASCRQARSCGCRWRSRGHCSRSATCTPQWAAVSRPLSRSRPQGRRPCVSTSSSAASLRCPAFAPRRGRSSSAWARASPLPGNPRSSRRTPS